MDDWPEPDRRVIDAELRSWRYGHYWILTLGCRHREERTARRSRSGDLRPPPATARCLACWRIGLTGRPIDTLRAEE